MASTPQYLGAPDEFACALTAADTAVTFKDFIVPSTPLKCGVITACSDNTADVVLQFARTVEGTDNIIGEVKIPAGSGTDGSATFIDVLAALRGNAAMLFKGAGSKLRVAPKTALAAGKRITLFAEAAQF